MTPDEIRAAAADEETQFGAWRNRTILAPGVEVGPPSPRAKIRAVEVTKAVMALAPDAKTVLDLGALNGTLYDPLAAAGMKVRAVEGRYSNCRKLKLLNQCRGYDGQVEVVETDVRDLANWRDSYDVVLCCGLLYHVPMPSALSVLDTAAMCANRLLVIDSLFGEAGMVHRDALGRSIRWAPFKEKDLEQPDSSLGDPTGTRFHGDDVIRRLTEDGFQPIFQHAVVWSLLPTVPGKDDSLSVRRQLYCVRASTQ